MTPAQLRKLDRELRAYFETMVTGMGRAERRRAMELYLTGLLMDGERKSVDPMAARLVEKASELTQGAVIRRILRHLQLPEVPAVLAPARGPAQQALWE